MGDLSEFGQFIKDGGTAGYVILTAGFFAAGLAVERLIRIRQYSVDSRAFMAKLKKYILSDNIDRAISLCNSKPGALLPKVLKAGLTRAKDSEADIQNAVDEATLEVLPKLEARSLYLPVLANLATLLGLFGTIVGLIMAFKGGDAVDAVQRQAFLQKAIALAMNSTAMGIMVAMPALFVNAFLQSKINGIISDIDQYSVKLINLLSASKKGGHVASSDDDSAAGE
ncbi:MAG: MotA/TolQ/ExbB proton channel family protein [Proteobacteria bacterium]|nr:MotA/TolQ/ExbB proton channel family protein [Pseudomonadota bacterium]